MLRFGALAESLGEQKRSPPLTPGGFDQELKKRDALAKERGVPLFTNGGDQPMIVEIFAKANELRDSGPRWGNSLGFSSCAIAATKMYAATIDARQHRHFQFLGCWSLLPELCCRQALVDLLAGLGTCIR